MVAPKARRFDFYPDDWLAGTRGLDASERGIYITACALIYSHGKPIAPDDLRASCPGDLRVYRKCLERLIKLGKLDLKRGYLSNKRCLSEVKLASNRVVKAVKNARKRWGETRKNNGLPDATADANQQCLPSPSPSPSELRKKEEDSEASASGADAPVDAVKSLWDRGLAILGEKHRSLFGKMRKEYTDPIVMEAIVETENECPSDPAAFLIACCQRRKANGRKQSAHAAQLAAFEYISR